MGTKCSPQNGQNKIYKRGISKKLEAIGTERASRGATHGSSHREG